MTQEREWQVEGAHVKVAGAVATLTFNRPESRNAISARMGAALLEPVSAAVGTPGVRCLVLRAEGDHFCGGGDLKDFAPMATRPPEARRAYFEQEVAAGTELFAFLDSLLIPIVAVVRGAVAGGGLAFVLSADVALASETAYFVFAHSRIGASLDAGVSLLLPRAVGLRKARELAVTGAQIDACEAARIGVVSSVLPDAELDAVADALITDLAGGATAAIGWSKRLLATSTGKDLRQVTLMEAEALADCAAGHDFMEGITSFVDRRRPQFTGK